VRNEDGNRKRKKMSFEEKNENEVEEGRSENGIKD
jgi:hypothetical protein